jgi:chromosome segregation protein
MEAVRADMGESRRRLAGIEEPIVDAEKRLRGRLESHRRVEGALAETREAVEERENEVKERERERSACEAEMGRERSARDELRLAWNAVLARRDAVAEQLAEAGFEAGQVVPTLPSEADPDAWQKRLSGIERRLDRLGPINLAAVSEFETESERKRYLDAQHTDLTDALATLGDAIRKIDRETRARFKDTFERVGRGLEEIFPRLFGGGNAYLELTGDDLLDTGVTVMARPPGKRNTSIQLLSGGEKALAAIALVFAIFDLNPAPFCLLDEVDAPLDDANVDRFVELVRELSERVQVMLVTHNKSSMEAMGQLIGVTMNEPGVSRLVSVDVGQALEMVAD